MSEAIVEQQMRYDVGVRVDGKNGVVLKGRTERLEIQLQGGGKMFSYNSLKASENPTPLERHFHTSLNRMMTLTLSDRMLVVGAEEGGGSVVESPLKDLPLFGPGELRQIITVIPQAFPGEAVGPGDYWILDGTCPVAGAGNLTFEITYRHMGGVNFEGNHCVSVEFSGQLSGEIPASETVEGEAATLVGLQGGGIDGRILYDPLDRMVRQSEQSINLLLNVPEIEGEARRAIPVQQIATLRLMHVVPMIP